MSRNGHESLHAPTSRLTSFCRKSTFCLLRDIDDLLPILPILFEYRGPTYMLMKVDVGRYLQAPLILSFAKWPPSLSLDIPKIIELLNRRAEMPPTVTLSRQLSHVYHVDKFRRIRSLLALLRYMAARRRSFTLAFRRQCFAVFSAS